MRSNLFRLQMLVLVSAVVFTGSLAMAVPDRGACCSATTSRLENLLNPNKGSDENFFTASGGPPTMMMILDTSCSMNAWPEDWPSTAGCNHPTFSGTGYDPSVDYPSLITGMTGPAGSKNPVFHDDWFDNGRVYRADGTGSFFTGGSPMGHNFSNSGAPAITSYTGGSLSTAMDNACAAVASSATAACKTCLQTAGYYVVNGTTRVATGNYLEYYGPRDVSAVITLSNILFNVREIRLGIITFDDWGGSCWDTSGDSVCRWQDLGPNCNQLYPFDGSAVENQRNSILNSLASNNPFSEYTPLASSLWAAMHYLRSEDSSDGFDPLFAGAYPTRSSFDEPNSSNQHTICTACSFNAALILTDGEPYAEVIGSFPPEVTALTTATNPYCPAGTGVCDSELDELAAFFWSKDIRSDLPGVQKVATYTIGFGTTTNANQLLASTAKVGGGKYYRATNAADVSNAFLAILDDIVSRNNSFSSSAVAAVQTGSSATPALLPRMRPYKGIPWDGYLWRFEQYNEFVTNNDLNSDGDKEDVFLVENSGTFQADGGPSWTAANIVVENTDGTFVKNGTSTPATPYWEANNKLATRDLTGGVQNRRVWTVFDRNNDGAFTSADTDSSATSGSDLLVRIQLNSADTDDLKLAEYYGLRGSGFCPNATSTGSLLGRFGLSISQAVSITAGSGWAWPGSPTADHYDRLCARLVTMWVLGADLLDADGDNNFTEVRQNVLGDIFHSSPVVVEPPSDAFLCDLGLSNQCVRTLYSQQLGVQETQDGTATLVNTGSGCDPGSPRPYDAYQFNNRKREKLVVVGANDGMIHAFVASRATAEGCVGGKPVQQWGADPSNARAGLEVWAFIPPDQLPKIPDLILGHIYMVDGDIMSRDIWADADADGRKDSNEFHTLVIASEGRGGKHYVALEPGFGNASWGAPTAFDANNRPNFRWVFPQPCTEESAKFGSTFYALSPKPPPIGPVLIDRASLPTTNPLNAATGETRYGVETLEQWMVALSGGWSPGLEKGRGIYFVDAWNGQINGRRDNLWWKFEYDDGASGSFNAPAKELVTSVPAPVAMVDYGANADPKLDGFFDTGVFGDTSGQMWITRFHTPGKYNATAKLINNWHAARTFEMDKDGVVTASADGDGEADETNQKSIANKAPFFYLPSVAIEPGVNKMRVFNGTGNRYGILETGPGVCRFDNPLACAKAGCGETKIVSEYRDAIIDISKAETHWKGRGFEHGKIDESLSVAATTALTDALACGTAGTKLVDADNSEYKVKTCDYPSSGTDPDPGDVNKISYDCGLNSAGTNFTCTRQSVTRSGALGNLVDVAQINQSGLGNNRYYGFWAYGGARVFVEEADGGTSPQAYDTSRLTDRSTASAFAGDLIDVSKTTCQANGSCDGGAGNSDYGWFIDYAGGLEVKTATGSAILASCVLWSDMAPTGGDGGVCGNTASPASSIYQADFITGQPNCAFGFLPTDGGAYVRSQTRNVVAPPPEPAAVVQISTTGQVRYSAMIVEPGKPQATNVNVSGSQDVLQLVYEVPISRSLHNCRHKDGGCVVTP